ncbi:MAG: hypothetical protein GF350_13110 [Chitinivibrionales bacterium]|nr:hypothetical protein [Chitinivibrionales bacterium]
MITRSAAFYSTLLLLLSQTFAQSIDIQGFVKDSANSLPLSGAVVSLVSAGLKDTTGDDGEYRWTVAENIEPYEYYDIRVQAHNDNSIYGELRGSDVVAITPAPFIEVTSPYASSRWGNDNRKSITWEQYGAGDKVIIELWKGTQKEKTISSSTDNDGSYSWKVSTYYICNSCYRIKVISASNSSIYGFSPNFSVPF